MRLIQRLYDALLRRSKLAHDENPAMAFLVFPAWMPVTWRERIACDVVRRELYELGLPWQVSDEEILTGSVNLLPVFSRRIGQFRECFERLNTDAAGMLANA